jgi:hypothetical protein
MPYEVIKKSIEESAKELVDQIKREAVTFKDSLVKLTCQEQSGQIISLERQLGEHAVLSPTSYFVDDLYFSSFFLSFFLSFLQRSSNR